MKKKILSIILWSMIAAAFIGPGTLTTASAAGAGYGYSLIWTLAFATIACIVIQEASARISIVNDSELPKVLLAVYHKRGNLISLLIGGSVIFGCAAYQAGNLLGTISGLELISTIPFRLMLFLLVVIVATLLFFGTYKSLAKVLSALVGIMGISFLLIVFSSDQSWSGIIVSLAPSIPQGSEWIVLGLVGTTIVPYNLFLGSGISKGQGLNEMRYGLAISVLLGGLISIAILISGSMIDGEFSFASLALTMQNSLGNWAVYLLAFGLFAAGFTSSVTAPLAAGFIARGFFSKTASKTSFRLGWGLVLLTGFVIGMLDFKPIPVIIAAQALNGFILPVIAVFLMILVNDPRILKNQVNNLWQNILYTIVMVIVIGLGVNNLWSAISNIFPNTINRSIILAVFPFLITVWTWWKVIQVRSIKV